MIRESVFPDNIITLDNDYVWKEMNDEEENITEVEKKIADRQFDRKVSENISTQVLSFIHMCEFGLEKLRSGKKSVSL